jgi:hypothetical protein
MPIYGVGFHASLILLVPLVALTDLDSSCLWLVETVCTRGILLKDRRVTAVGRPQPVIDAYRQVAESAEERKVLPAGEDQAEIASLELLPVGKWASEREATPESGLGLSFTDRVSVDFRLRLFIRLASPDGISFYNHLQRRVRGSRKPPTYLRGDDTSIDVERGGLPRVCRAVLGPRTGRSDNPDLRKTGRKRPRLPPCKRGSLLEPCQWNVR